MPEKPEDKELPKITETLVLFQRFGQSFIGLLLMEFIWTSISVL
jgi:hypothetical protein